MKRMLVGAMTVGLMGAVPPSAVAHDQIVGGCGLVAAPWPTAAATYTGLLFVAAHTRDSFGLPTQGTAWDCDLRVDNTSVGTLTGVTTNASGLGLNAVPVTFRVDPGSTVSICETVSHADGHIDYTCYEISGTRVPPPVVTDTLTQGLDVAGEVLCLVLRGIEDEYGPVWIDGQGDVYGDPPIGKVWDCWPYDGDGQPVPSPGSVTQVYLFVR